MGDRNMPKDGFGVGIAAHIFVSKIFCHLRTGRSVGTQAWVDPARRVAYILMVQRSNFPNSDASGVRRAFQQAAADAR
jgi:hypothetical protein